MSDSQVHVQIPQFPLKVVEDLVKRLYNIEIDNVKQLNGYDDKNFWLRKVTSDSTEWNWPHGYVLKITNERDSRVDGWLEAQTLLLSHMNNKGLLCPEPMKNVNGHVLALERIKYREESDNEAGYHIVRVLKFIPGKVICATTYTVQKLRQVGELLARFHASSEDFYHSGYEQHKPLWSLMSLPQIKSYVYVFDDKEKRDLLCEVIETFEMKVISNYDKLRKGLIHGDFNEQNILIDEDEGGREAVVSFLDLGDSHMGPYAFDVGLTIMYMMLDSTTVSTLDVGGHVLKGFLAHRPLSDFEFGMLKSIVCARVCQSLTLGMFTYNNNPIPENSYVLTTQKKGWPLLEMFWNTDESVVYNRWKQILSE